jgi:hypothetical protein
MLNFISLRIFFGNKFGPTHHWEKSWVCEVFKNKKYGNMLSDNIVLSDKKILSALIMMLSDNMLSDNTML